MSALINHVLSRNCKILTIPTIRNVDFIQSRNLNRCKSAHTPKRKYKQKREKVFVPECRKLSSDWDSVASRGFLRCQKEYNPPENVEDEIKTICAQFGDIGGNCQFPNNIKFKLFNECFKKFNHGVPNSLLHTIKNCNDLLAFYTTPIDTVLPLDKLKTVALPKNLHIQYEPHRFHPDEDTMFKGQTAFPKSNTLVTGLRTRKKYKGCKVTDYWPGS